MTKHIVVIGLPASGKSSLSTQYVSTHVIHDDFLDSFVNGKLLSDLEEKHVWLSDPRLCNKTVFDNYIRSYCPPTMTELILFENDPEASIANIGTRDHKERWINTIRNFSKMYSLDNYEGYSKSIVKVHS
jgi:hypothetical protein